MGKAGGWHASLQAIASTLSSHPRCSSRVKHALQSSPWHPGMPPAASGRRARRPPAGRRWAGAAAGEAPPAGRWPSPPCRWAVGIASGTALGQVARTKSMGSSSECTGSNRHTSCCTLPLTTAAPSRPCWQRRPTGRLGRRPQPTPRWNGCAAPGRAGTAAGRGPPEGPQQRTLQRAGFQQRREFELRMPAEVPRGGWMLSARR